MVRVILIPVMIAVYLILPIVSLGGYPMYFVLGLIFVAGSLTDFIDGYIARKRNLVTTFGKFMDPLADKLLVMTALLILMDISRSLEGMWMPFWIPLIILSREVIVTSIRLVAVGEGNIIAASPWGKAKTFATMGAIAFYFFLVPLGSFVLGVIGILLMTIAVGLTLISGFDYFWKNRNLIFQSK
jgi:CDP-diacylglycerol--glycerol-3-phosphate 3-phosphatidyltransferase